MPAAIKDLRAGDMVLHRGKPMYVQSVEEDGIHCIDILNSENKVIVPVTNMFGFNFVTKVVFLMNFNAAQPSAENPFGNLMPFMMMSSVNDDQNVITLPRNIIRDYIDGGKFATEIPCNSEGQELTTMNQDASKANDNW